MRDLYSVTLTPKQVARACEEYVLRQNADGELMARAQVSSNDVIVVISTKRKSPNRAAEAKQAGVRG